MQKLLINTPQNVDIEYSLASVGSRIIAIGLDYALMLAYGIVVYYFSDKLFGSFEDGWLFYGLLYFLLLPILFYHLLFETFNKGQTIGMKVLKIKVVKLDGTRASIYEYFIRWVFNIVDVWMLGGIIGLTAIVLTKQSQRIGDLAAGTTIISLKPRLQLLQTIYEEVHTSYTIRYPQVIQLTDKDINIIKQTFEKAQLKDDPVILKALVQKVKSVLELEEIDQTDKAFINSVIKDHYTLFKEI